MKRSENEVQFVANTILQADQIFAIDKNRAYSMLRDLSLSLNHRIGSIEHKKCDVYIPAPKFPCPASMCLNNEGVKYIKHTTKDQYDYGNFVADLWLKNESFIILEHDIAPYPEAIYNIMWCDYPWCAYEYFHHKEYKLYAMGCTKFSKYLIENSQDISEKYNWRKTEWNILDGKIFSGLVEKFGRPHIHHPSVAHVK